MTGLLAVKNLVEQGLSVRALEQSENLGGNWYHSMDTEQVSALPETRVNMSKETVSGSDPETMFAVWHVRLTRRCKPTELFYGFPNARW